MTAVETLIDKAAFFCGGQAALAERLQVSRSAVTEWKKGRSQIPDKHIPEIARCVQMEAADVWTLLNEARNPFRQGRAVAASLVLFFAFSGGLTALPEKAHALTPQGGGGNSQGTEQTAHCHAFRMARNARHPSPRAPSHPKNQAQLAA